MQERRQHSRQNAGLQLEVFERASGRCLGRVVDLSCEGFMIFGDPPPAASATADYRLVSARTVQGIGEVTLGADRLWSRAAADGHRAWSGYHIVDLEEGQATALRVLLDNL